MTIEEVPVEGKHRKPFETNWSREAETEPQKSAVASKSKVGSMNKTLIALRKSLLSDYSVTFRLRHCVAKGDSIAVIGSLVELNKWRSEGPFMHELRQVSEDLW